MRHWRSRRGRGARPDRDEPSTSRLSNGRLYVLAAVLVAALAMLWWLAR